MRLLTVVVVFCVIVAGLEVGTLIVECGCWCYMLNLGSESFGTMIRMMLRILDVNVAAVSSS